jgi:hypothetical protein
LGHQLKVVIGGGIAGIFTFVVKKIICGIVCGGHEI